MKLTAKKERIISINLVDINFSDSIKNVLNDDDRDIFYYDKERKIQTNSLRPEMLGVPDSKKEEVTSAKQPKKKGV